MKNLYAQLTDKSQLTISENIVASYIIKSPESILISSIYDLASVTHTSPATITRLCKKCHVKDFRDFKIFLASEYKLFTQSPDKIDANIPFQPGDSEMAILERMAHLEIETITETKQYMTATQIQRIINMLVSAEMIYGIGVSENYMRLKEFQLRLLKINRYIQILNLQAEQYYLAVNGKPTDVAIIISYSGSTAEIVSDAKHFRQNGTPIIAITSNLKSPLATYATETLLIPNKENMDTKIAGFSSQTSITYILNTLYACLFNRNFDQNIQNQQNTPVSHF